MTPIEKTIGYTFKDESLLKHAMTHSSYLNEHGLPKEACNERLEFMGDAILEMISSDFLYHYYPDKQEGELSKIRASLVCEKSLAVSAREIGVGESLILGKGMEMGGGRESDAIISDAFEALIAALYLDGGLEEAKKLVHEHVLTDIEDRLLFIDSKTILQELLQDRKQTPEYRVTDESGPEHLKQFEVTVFVDGVKMGSGKGRNKKEAQQQAALQTIKLIKE